MNGEWSWPCVHAELGLSEDAGATLAAPIVTRVRAIDAGVTGSSGKWAGAVYTPRGEVMCMPYNADRALFISVDGGTRLGAQVTTGFRYSGGVLANDGFVYAVPFTSVSANLLRLDVQTGQPSTVVITTAQPNGTSPRLCGAVADSRGRVWMLPYASNRVVLYDPDAGTQTGFTVDGIDGGTTNWCAGALTPDGRIFGMPQARTELLEIQTSDGGLRRIQLDPPISGVRQIGAVVARTGELWGIPQGFFDIVVVQTDGTFRREALGRGDYNGGALAPEGRVVYLPEGDEPVVAYRTSSSTFDDTPSGAPGGAAFQWKGAATGRDGRIYACPYYSDDVLIIDTGARRPLGDRALLSPWLNKP